MRKIRIIIGIILLSCIVSVLPAKASTLKSCKTQTQAALLIREKMKSHSKTITFLYPYNKCKESMLLGLIKEASKPTKNPKEGDYLYYSLDKVGATIKKYGKDQAMITYELKYRTTLKEEALVDQQVNKILGNLKLKNQKEEQKIKKIYDYICSHVSYDSTYRKYTAYDALITKKSVCEGYALALQRLLLESGVECRVMPGKAGNEKHMWNIVKVGKKWYNLDATTDARNHSRYCYLCCNDELIGYQRESSYLTKSFNQSYSMSKICYQKSCINKLTYYNKKFTAATYHTVDGKRDTIGKDKKNYKLVVYYPVNDSLSKDIVKSLSNLSILKKSNIRMVAVEVGRASKAKVTSLKKKCGKKHVSFTFDPTYKSYNELCTNFKKVTGTTKASFPIIMIVDPKNKVRYLTMGGDSVRFVNKAMSQLSGK
ncbi:S-layer protein [Lachnospiraceae bacterium KM106-2]|nr:S-layer protein [Lachnospiraceae bacterium KM106-2]